MIGKNCLHEKIAEINCLRGASEKIVCRDYPCHARFGELKKIVCAVSGGKQFASAESMLEKFPGVNFA